MPKASVFLEGLFLEYFRGIGERQYLSPFRQFNLFIGANNAGKSTVLAFLSEVLAGLKNDGRPRLRPLDYYRGAKSGETAFGFGVSKGECLDRLLVMPEVAQYKAHLNAVLDRLSGNGDTIWFARTGAPGWQPEKTISVAEALAIGPDYQWQRVWHALTRRSGGGFQQHWLPETLQSIVDSQSFAVPRIRQIPSLRQIGPQGSGFEDFSGNGLINKIAELQSPDHDRRGDLELFEKINSFLRVVTDRPEARIEIPHNKEHVLIHMDNKVLPLASLGMGIHEVVMIAAFCTIAQGEIVCIEEPETHLHPLLQRKLIRYLREATTNQYFVATHSAAFIDTEGAAIFHVSNDGSQTKITEAVLRKSRYEVCADLGYRASDLVQANSVVWVEGPSDRVYLNSWIRSLSPDLVEGVHYSIMFYGGRLLSHLSAESDDVGEFISLRSLNQNSHILIDSDFEDEDSTLNDTKVRAVDEFRRGGGVAWVTAGREIENYVPHATLQAAVAQVAPGIYVRPAKGDRFSHGLHYYRRKAVEDSSTFLQKEVDKVAVSKLVAMHPVDMSVLDLKTRVDEIVSAIRKANA